MKRALLLLAALPAAADEGLGLQQAIEMALRRNLDLEVERLNPAIAEEGVAKARSAWDPTLKAGYTDNDARTSPTSTLSGATALATRTTTYSAGVAEKLPTGTTLDLALSYVRDLTNSAFSTVNPSHTSTATLTVKQPLLKGFGIEVNRAELEAARLGREGARHAFAAKVSDTVAAVEGAYWDLVAAIEDIGVKKAALEAAKSLESTNQAKVDAGTLPKTDLLEASSAAASREADLIDAERKSEDARDRLRQMIDPGSPAEALTPSDRPTPPELKPDVQAAIARALEGRSELAQARDAVRKSLVGRMSAKNALLPDLSLSGSWGQSGVDADRDDSLSRLNDGRARTWEVGLALEFPLGNRSARSDLRKAEAQTDQESARLRALEQSVVAEVRAATRAVEAGRRRLDATERAVAFSSEQYRSEVLRFEQGLSTTHAVLEILKNDTAEKGRHLASQVDYLKAVSAWHRAQGTLLEAKGIRLE